MDYQGKAFTVDGAPSLFDFQSFIENFDKALVQTQASAAPGADGKRWDRFARQVLGAQNDTPANRALLLTALGKLIDWEAQTEALNHTDLRYGAMAGSTPSAISLTAFCCSAAQPSRRPTRRMRLSATRTFGTSPRKPRCNGTASPRTPS